MNFGILNLVLRKFCRSRFWRYVKFSLFKKFLVVFMSQNKRPVGWEVPSKEQFYCRYFIISLFMCSDRHKPKGSGTYTRMRDVHKGLYEKLKKYGKNYFWIIIIIIMYVCLYKGIRILNDMCKYVTVKSENLKN